MNTDYTCFTYNSLEPIHGITGNTKWRDRLVGYIVNSDAVMRGQMRLLHIPHPPPLRVTSTVICGLHRLCLFLLLEIDGWQRHRRRKPEL